MGGEMVEVKMGKRKYEATIFTLQASSSTKAVFKKSDCY